MYKKLKTLLASGIMLGAASAAFAQAYVPATYTESLIVSGAHFLNSAVIDYTPNCTNPGGCGKAQLNVLSWHQISTSSLSGFKVDDGLGSPLTVYLSSTATFPDVIVGNNTSNPANYLVGVTYIDGTDIKLSIYDISNVGTGIPLSATLTGTYFIAGGVYPTTFPRIDITADYSNLISGGYPLCDAFIITYGLSGIQAYASSLNNPSVSTANTVSTPHLYPDVASIKRYNSVTGGIDDVGLFTYMGGSGLYYREWDITTNTLSTEYIIDPSLTGILKMPKIDAVDDYTLNDPSSGNAYYSVVAVVGVGHNTHIKLYNNLVPTGGVDISAWLLGSTNNAAYPTITAGPCQTYIVQYPIDNNTKDVIAMNIDWSTGSTDPGYPDGWSTSTYSYYQTNQNPASDMSLTMPDLVTVAGTCNPPSSAAMGNYFMSAWNESGNAYGKSSSGCTPAFRHATSNVNSTTAAQWALSPNPATETIVLSMGVKPADAQYFITDMAGRQVASGTVAATQQTITISDLSSGIYLLQVLNDGQKVKTFKFVKN